mmetsp:Transcript_95889/g.209769  ORF Transcript_95889/g.209769 Transcript_95889/m.209769 type:complete len:350 (+) Transcript_95889:532-1581(+)
MRIPLRLVVPSVELTSLNISALHTLLMVIPSVLAVAPAIMSAGYMTKVLAPHSALPGAVIILVPIVVSSFVWALFTVMFQYTTNPSALAIMLICVSYPFVYIIIGFYYRLAQPVRPATLHKAARASSICNLVLLIALGILAYIFAQDINQNVLEHLKDGAKVLDWCHVSWSRLVMAMLTRTVYAFALTYFSASDWMIAEVAMQQRYWSYWGAQRALLAPRASLVAWTPNQLDSYTSVSHSASPGSQDRQRRESKLPMDDDSEDEASLDTGSIDLYVGELLRHRFLKRQFFLRMEAEASAVAAANAAASANGDPPGGSWEEGLHKRSHKVQFMEPEDRSDSSFASSSDSE